MSLDSTVPRISAVMPCLNEERTLGLCIEKAFDAFRHLGVAGEVVVADNGSTDNSVSIAKSMGANVVQQPIRGYGAALQAGIEAAQGDIIVMGDCDDSYDWQAIGPFIRKVEEGNDVVIGNRFKGGIEADAMPPLHRYFGNPVLSALTRWFFGAPVGDCHCGMRAFSKRAAEQMHLKTTGMEFATEMVVHASRAGLRIAEIPTRLYPDKRDRPPHLRSFRDGWRHLRFMMTYAPDHLYLMPGGILLLLGLAGMFSLLSGPLTLGGMHIGIHFLALSCLLTLLGINIVGFGVLGKLINTRVFPLPPDSLLARWLPYFSLEKGLLLGLGVALSGLAGDIHLVGEWLSRKDVGMEETVHFAFVTNTVLMLGINLIFGSFLLNLCRQELPLGSGSPG